MILSTTLHAEMKTFAPLYGFKHITSSPHYPQSNGQAERTVKTVKGLLQDSPDIFLLLLSYCATPLPCCGLSPGELLMDRRLRTDVPETKRHLTPNCPHLQGFLEKDKEMKQKQKEGMTGSTEYALSQHCQTTLQYAWVNTQGHQVPGRVVTTADTPLSYACDGDPLWWSHQKELDCSGNPCREHYHINHRHSKQHCLQQDNLIPSRHTHSTS